VTDTESWYLAEKSRVNAKVFTYVKQLDRFQFDTFNRFKQLEALYDVTPRPGAKQYRTPKGYGRMHENVIASNVDTVSAQIATTEVRAVFDTDDADWSTQRRARRLEWYAEGLGKLLQVPQKCRHAFKAGGAVKGNAINKVWTDKFDRICVKPVMVDDIVVDESECRGGEEPRQLHYRTAIDRDELKAEYPKFKTQIAAAQGGYGQWQTWAGWRPLRRSDILVIESWRKPIGVKGKDGYLAGRHTVTIDGCDLLDEEYHEDYFPFAIMRWSKPVNGWYGIGLAERIAGIQLALNRRNLQNERKLDHGAFPTTWVQRQDAALATAQASVMQNTLGTVAVYGGSQPPTTVTPPAVSPEELRDADRLSAKASEVSGVSRMASQSVKPAGIETGVALREYRDQTTQRFAEQEKDYELFVLDTVWLVIACCKKLGAKAPVITRKTRFGSRKIEWDQVDMKEVRVWIGAASTLSRTRAGREQTVVEWAQAGIISQDSAKRLIGHPDLEREMSLYTAAIENADECLEEIADGNVVMPEPFMNLKLLVWRAQQQYLNWSAGGSERAAPEDVLENLRSLIVQAVWMDTGGDVEAMNQNAVGPDMSMPAQPGAPGAPMPGMPGGVPPLPAGPPMATPQAAFAPQAMQLVAGV
jgi:hypothetical protein